VITAAVALITFTTRIHPLWVLAAGALAGLSGIGLS
jgi:chromate transporter